MLPHIKPVTSAQDLRTYIRLPEHLPDRRPNEVLALRTDEEAYHDPARNPALAGCEIVRYMALRGNHPVGRIMGLIHHGHNARHNERRARFYQLDSENDPHVTGLLVRAVEEWARSRGMERMIGPFGTSDKDPQGFQVEGFEHLPVLATPSNAEHLPEHIQQMGYTKVVDALEYKVDIPERLPNAYYGITQRIKASGDFHMVPLAGRKALRPWVLPVLRLVNETYTDLFGFNPMSEAEMKHLAEQYMPVLDPAFVKIIADRSERPVAFVVAMPDMSEGLRRARGRLFPFGLLHILWSMRRTKQLDLFLGAVHPEHQSRGLTCWLAIELLSTAHQRGFRVMDSHLIMETNTRMCAEVERLGGVPWKRFRVFGRDL